ncbi:MAG: CAP domain-containing protein [Anaerolineae bacterium]|nr:CAP domain-containing protein [Anaerolineae bacterium]
MTGIRLTGSAVLPIGIALTILLVGCAGQTTPTPAVVSPPPVVATVQVPTRTPQPTPTARPTNTLVPTLPLPPTRTPVPLPDLEPYARYMLELINRDRRAAGLLPVQWDETAVRVARAHAEEMASYVYLSHWNLAGYGPEHRYFFAGGRDAVRENVYAYYQRSTTGSGIPIQDWQKIVEQAQETLMESASHRENILQPSHTHVGIGIGYNPTLGEVRIAQEFVDRYVVLEPVAESARPGDAVAIAGRLLPGASSPLINLAYEPLPTPMSVADLNKTGSYTPRAETFHALKPLVEGSRFRATIRFTELDRSGLYHIRVWVEREGQPILAGNVIIPLR